MVCVTSLKESEDISECKEHGSKSLLGDHEALRQSWVQNRHGSVVDIITWASERLSVISLSLHPQLQAKTLPCKARQTVVLFGPKLL